MSEIVLALRGAITFPLERLGIVGPLENIHSGSKTETGSRLYALDLARFLAMCFMMQGHVLDSLVSRDIIVTTEFPWSFWHVFRGFTAPIFLVVSGAVHAFATKRNADGSVTQDVISKRIRWALTIIGIGYIMMFPAGSVFHLPFVSQDAMQNFLGVNILQLTGATLLLFIVTMAGTKSVRHMGRRALWVTGAILAVTPFLQMLSDSQFAPLWLQNYLTTGYGSLFPMFPFSAYLFGGVAVGARLYEVPKEQRDSTLKKYGWRIGLAIVALSLLATNALEYLGVGHDYLEKSMSVPLFLRRFGFVLMFFSLSVVILNATWGMRKWWSMFGMKSLWIYIIHLVLLYGMPWANGLARTHYRQFGLVDGIIAAAAIITLTLICAWAMDTFSKKEYAKVWTPRITTTIIAFLLLGLLV